MSSTMVNLEKICDVIRGVTFKPEDLVPPFTEHSIVVMRTKNVQVKGLDYEDLISIPLDLVKDQKKFLIDGDLLISSANSWYLVGKTSFFETNKLASPVTAGGFISIIRPKASIKSKYLYHWLTTDKSQHKIRHFGRQTTNISNLDFSQFKTLEIPLPPLPEQQRIADILDKAEAINQKREQALALCDEFLRATFLDMFGHPVSNPKGWEVKKLSKFGEVITGSTPSRGKPEYYGNHIEWIKSDNINTPNNYITRAKEFLSVEGESVGRSVPENSILMTCIAGSLDCIGNIALADRKVSFNQQINGIVPNDDVDVHFLYSLLLYSKKYIQNHSTNSMKGMISKGKLSEIKFYLPEMAIQKEFSDIFLKIESLRNKIQHAQELPLFDALSQQAFKGELTQ